MTLYSDTLDTTHWTLTHWTLTHITVTHWKLAQEPVHSDAVQALAGGTISALQEFGSIHGSLHLAHLQSCFLTKWCCIKVTPKLEYLTAALV